MKKQITLLTIVLAICMLATCVYAATATAKATISLTASKTSLNPGDEVVIYLKTTSLEGITDISSYEGILSFDEEVFEPITERSVTGGKYVEINTDSSLGEDYGHFVVGNYESDKKVSGTITLKVKPQVKTTSTTVTVSKFIAADIDNQTGEGTKTAPASTSITLQVKEDGNDNGNGNGNQGLGNNGNISGTNTNKAPTNVDQTTSGTKLPKTGVAGYIAVVIAIIAIIAVVSIVRYKNIMK